MEWTNVAARPELAAVKAELARFLPATNAPDAGPKDAGDGADVTKAAKKKAPPGGEGKKGRVEVVLPDAPSSPLRPTRREKRAHRPHRVGGFHPQLICRPYCQRSVRTTGCGRGGPKESVNGRRSRFRTHALRAPSTPPPPEKRATRTVLPPDLPEPPSRPATIGNNGKKRAGAPTAAWAGRTERCGAASSSAGGRPSLLRSSPDGDTVTDFATISATKSSRKSIVASLSADMFAGSGGTLIVVRGESGGGGGGGVGGAAGPGPVSEQPRHRLGIDGFSSLGIDQQLRRYARTELKEGIDGPGQPPPCAAEVLRRFRVVESWSLTRPRPAADCSTLSRPSSVRTRLASSRSACRP